MTRVRHRELRQLVLNELDIEDWKTPSNVRASLTYDGFELGWNGFERVALELERMAHQGIVEIRNPRSRGKRFFRRID